MNVLSREHGLRYRRDLDLQVAEAVRFTSEIAREVTRARLQRDEAVLRLEKAQWDAGSTIPRWVGNRPDPGPYSPRLGVGARATSTFYALRFPQFSNPTRFPTLDSSLSICEGRCDSCDSRGSVRRCPPQDLQMKSIFLGENQQRQRES